MADQQFCLRWNNHQSTLISVFDSLLERGAMVDCTLAAEGQCLQAHKVVLSACSPYLETLLSQHYDKHPILLLKDVKFYELQAMMDYMYRGEVNVAQDKLGMFLKAAESLQIKGLSDSGGNEPPDTGGGTSSKRTSKGAPVTNIPRSGGGLTVERRRPQPQTSQVVDIPSDSGSRDGSESPSLRRKRRRRTSGDDSVVEGDSSSTGDVSRTQPSAAPLSSDQVPMNGSADSNALGILSSLMDGSVETDNSVQEPGPSLGNSSQTQPSQRIREKLEPTSAEMIQPKAEYLESEENVEDLTLDDDDDTGMDAGPSQRQGSGYQWHMGDQSADEVFMAAQEAVGANRDAQALPSSPAPWSVHPKTISYNYPMKEEPESSPSPGVEVISWTASVTPTGHSQGNIAVEEFLQQTQHHGVSHLASSLNTTGSSYGPGHFPCETCGKVYRYKGNLSSHVRLECGKERQFQCPHCPHKSKQKIHLIRHIRSKHQGNQQHAPPVMGLLSQPHQSILPHTHSSLAWHPHIPPPQVMLQVAASTQAGESRLDNQTDLQQQPSPSQLPLQLTNQQQQSQQQQLPQEQQHIQSQMTDQQQAVASAQTSPQQLSSSPPYTPNRATTP